MKVRFFITAIAVSLTVPVLAHHAFSAEFDANAPITLKGEITRIEWINPHTWIHIAVDAKGKSDEWMVEGGRRTRCSAAASRATPARHGDRRPGLRSKDGRMRANDGTHLRRRPHAGSGSSGTGARVMATIHRKAARRSRFQSMAHDPILAIAVATLFVSACAPAPSTPAAYRARTADGKPDISGIWQANNSANWNIEPHEAKAGPACWARPLASRRVLVSSTAERSHVPAAKPSATRTRRTG